MGIGLRKNMVKKYFLKINAKLLYLYFLYREAIQEDEHGIIESSVAEIIHKEKRKRLLDRKEVSRLGMMRHLYVVLDCSESMTTPDLKPTRFLCSVKVRNY